VTRTLHFLAGRNCRTRALSTNSTRSYLPSNPLYHNHPSIFLFYFFAILPYTSALDFLSPSFADKVRERLTFRSFDVLQTRLGTPRVPSMINFHKWQLSLKRSNGKLDTQTASTSRFLEGIRVLVRCSIILLTLLSSAYVHTPSTSPFPPPSRALLLSLHNSEFHILFLLPLISPPNTRESARCTARRTRCRGSIGCGHPWLAVHATRFGHAHQEERMRGRCFRPKIRFIGRGHGLLLYLLTYTFVSSFLVAALATWEYACVQGASGPVDHI